MLELNDVAIYRAGTLLTRVSVVLGAGQGALVQGPNGCGKTTLLRTVCGWRPTFRGRMAWRGQPLPSATAALREGLAYLGHRDGLHDDLTPSENLCWLMRLGNEACTAASADEALDRMGLGPLAAKPVRMLSQGQRRRTALARFLLTRKPLWVLDEPLASLDKAAQGDIVSAVRRHLQAGGLALLSCHSDSWSHDPSIRRISLTANLPSPA